MTPAQAVEAVKTWFPQWESEREKLDKLDIWLRDEQELPPLGRRSTSEHKMLRELSRGAWLSLVPTALSQTLRVDGHRSPVKPIEAPVDAPAGPPTPWDIWLGNDLDARQQPLHWSTLGYGYTFATILPGIVPGAGARMAVVRGVSPRNMYAAYADEVHDEWPILAIGVKPQRGGKFMLRLYDEQARYFLSCDGSGTTVEYISYEVHDAGFCPVARNTNGLDLEGRTLSEIKRLIPNGKRIDKTIYDRMLAQHFNSWKVKTGTGLAQPDPPAGLTSEEETAWIRDADNKTKMRLAQEDMLVAEDKDARFGTLDETSLAGFNAAHEADLEDLAATSQIARQNFGQMINMPAEAFTAAETAQRRRSDGCKVEFGRFWDQVLRAAAGMSGNTAAAADFRAHVTWADTTVATLSQAADALGKLAAQLGIPPEGLWERIPGVTDTDITLWKALVEKGDGLGQFAAQLEKIAGQPTPPAG